LGQAIITDKVLLSEGSHSSIGLATAEEYGLSSFIKHSRKLPEQEPLSAELLLSGRGIASIYEFLRLTRFAKEQGLPGRLDAAEISASQTKNRCSKATMKWFAHFLAQHCKDLALTTYATGGLFLGGGILKKNKELLNTQFLTEFSRHSAHQYRAILENIPVSLITHTDAALLGAVVAMEKK
jgi:glucokinase